jgi:hypothetical protein
MSIGYMESTGKVVESETFLYDAIQRTTTGPPFRAIIDTRLSMCLIHQQISLNTHNIYGLEILQLVTSYHDHGAHVPRIR